MRILQSIILLLLAALLTTCHKDEMMPVVITLSVSDITDSTAICGGEVIGDGNTHVLERGVCWSTAPNPNNLTKHIADTIDGKGMYFWKITDLAPDKIYYVRAYATNSAGTSYGDERSFVTTTQNVNVFTITANGVSFNMIKVQGGTFTMGCTGEQGGDCYNDETPVHLVTLTEFYIGEIEVTQALWQAVMGNNPSYSKGDNLPVENVSWDDCQAFIRKLNQLTGHNFRLPTEAEWEYAARGGNKSCGYKYAGSNAIGAVAWYSNNSNSWIHPVKTKSPNELGLYDMSGNVWEWCADWYGGYSSDSQTNPQGPSTGSYRVSRGGSWYDYARCCRVSHRSRCTPGIRDKYLGFRLALL